jgi:hypothetical protein
LLRWIALLILLAASFSVDLGSARAAPGSQYASCSSNTIGELTFVNCFGSGNFTRMSNNTLGANTYGGSSWGGFVGVASPSGNAGSYVGGSSAYFPPRMSVPLTSWTCFPYTYTYYYLPC